MLEELKNIDNLFRNASKEFEKEPPLYAWDKLNNDLDKKKKKKKILYFYRIAASIAIILSFLGGYYISNYNKNNTKDFASNNVLRKNKKDASFKKESHITLKKINLNTSDSSRNQSQIFEQEKTSVVYTANNIVNKNINKETLINKNDIQQHINKYQIKQDTNPKFNISNEIVSVKNNDTLKKETNISPDNLTVLIQDKGNTKTKADSFPQKVQFNKIELININNPIVLNDVKVGKWSVEGQVTPAYSSKNNSENSSSTGDFKDKPVMTYSGGFKIDYNNKRKYSIETGVLYTSLGIENAYSDIYINKDLILNGGNINGGDIPLVGSSGNYPNLIYNIETSSGDLELNSEDFPLADIADNQNSTQDSNYYIYPANYSILQKYQFIEIPLIFKYKLIDKKIGVNISVGLCAAYLIRNKSYANIDNKKYDINNNKSIDNFMYSCVFGIGLKYPIYKEISMNFEPNIKYALKPIYKSNISKYVPYLISLSMGVCYDFK